MSDTKDEEKWNEFRGACCAEELTSRAETTPREATAASRAVAKKWIFMMAVELMCTKLVWWINERCSWLLLQSEEIFCGF